MDNFNQPNRTLFAKMRGWIYARPFWRRLLRFDKKPQRVPIHEEMQLGVEYSLRSVAADFLDNFNFIVLYTVFTSLLVIGAIYILSFPDGLPGLFANILADVCRSTGQCNLTTLLPALGAALIILNSVVIGFFALLSSRDDDITDELYNNQVKIARLLEEIREYQTEYLPEIHRHTRPAVLSYRGTKKVERDDAER